MVGVFKGETLIQHWRLVTEKRTSDELGLFLTHLLQISRVPVEEIKGAALSSVYPPLDAAWEDALSKYIGIECLRVSSELDLGLEIHYKVASEVGADRLVNAVGGITHYGKPLVIVDSGTAITLDVISSDGGYLGGAIAPGLIVSMEALFSKTAKLPQVPLTHPAHAIGGSTSEAIQSGILFGYAGLVDALVERIWDELGEKAPVIATGGHAQILADYSKTIQKVDPWLTLDGLRLIFTRNRPKGIATILA